MVSDEEIVAALETLLGQPNFYASGDILHQLEHKLGVDLYHKWAFIRERVDLIVQSKHVVQHQQHHLHSYPSQVQPQFHHLGVAAAATGAGVPVPYPPHCEELVGMPSFDPKTGFACPVKVDMPQPSVAPEIPKDSCSPAQVQSSMPARSKRRGGPGGLNKLCGVSPELQVIVGEPAMARTQIVKQLWAYIRNNNLQDPSNKRKIICNDPLRVVFETDCTDMFKMNKLLAKHILPLEPTKDSGSVPKRMTSYLDSPAQGAVAGPAPVIISDALAIFFGNGEREILPSEAMKRIWNYIQSNQLEDPLNSMVICDYSLRGLFNCERFIVGSLPELLSQHFLKR